MVTEAEATTDPANGRASVALKLDHGGIHRVRVTGNVKFDITPPADAAATAGSFRTAFGTDDDAAPAADPVVSPEPGSAAEASSA